MRMNNLYLHLLNIYLMKTTISGNNNFLKIMNTPVRGNSSGIQTGLNNHTTGFEYHY